MEEQEIINKYFRKDPLDLTEINRIKSIRKKSIIEANRNPYSGENVIFFGDFEEKVEKTFFQLLK